MANIASSLAKIKAEAERLEVMDNAASIMAEHLYGADLLTQVKEYRAIMLHVSISSLSLPPSLPSSLPPSLPLSLSPSLSLYLSISLSLSLPSLTYSVTKVI